MVKLQPLPLAHVRARLHELFACMSLMRAQGLIEAPEDARITYHSALDGRSSLLTVRNPSRAARAVLTVPSACQRYDLMWCLCPCPIGKWHA